MDAARKGYPPPSALRGLDSRHPFARKQPSPERVMGATANAVTSLGQMVNSTRKPIRDTTQ